MYSRPVIPGCQPLREARALAPSDASKRVPRYHFNIHDGRSGLDLDGSDLVDRDTARLAAIKLAGVVIADDGHMLRSGSEWHMDVTDASGLILYRLDFSVIDAPSAESLREQTATHP